MAQERSRPRRSDSALAAPVHMRQAPSAGPHLRRNFAFPLPRSSRVAPIGSGCRADRSLEQLPSATLAAAEAAMSDAAAATQARTVQALATLRRAVVQHRRDGGASPSATPAQCTRASQLPLCSEDATDGEWRGKVWMPHGCRYHQSGLCCTRRVKGRRRAP